jgi:hypothetical protein
MTEPQQTDRLGVSKVEYFFSLHGWLFREQHLHDYGIDAQVEIVKNGRPTGELIAIQIKSGSSYFTERTGGHIVFRTNDNHINYWLKHLLPVILVLYDVEEDICYWEVISDDTIVKTGKGWKVSVPISKKLTNESLDELCELTQPPPYIRKLNKLRLDKKWIQLLAEGETVYIEYEDWINKSLPRYIIQIGCDSKEDVESEEWPILYGLSMEEAIAYILPWADYEMDYDAHYEFMESIWFDECYMGRDLDDGTPYFSTPFSEWYQSPDEIVPVSENGETEGYRLILSINKLGRAFLDLDEYLSK